MELWVWKRIAGEWQRAKDRDGARKTNKKNNTIIIKKCAQSHLITTVRRTWKGITLFGALLRFNLLSVCAPDTEATVYIFRSLLTIDDLIFSVKYSRGREWKRYSVIGRKQWTTTTKYTVLCNLFMLSILSSSIRLTFVRRTRIIHVTIVLLSLRFVTRNYFFPHKNENNSDRRHESTDSTVFCYFRCITLSWL